MFHIPAVQIILIKGYGIFRIPHLIVKLRLPVDSFRISLFYCSFQIGLCIGIIFHIIRESSQHNFIFLRSHPHGTGEIRIGSFPVLCCPIEKSSGQIHFLTFLYIQNCTAGSDGIFRISFCIQCRCFIGCNVHLQVSHIHIGKSQCFIIGSNCRFIVSFFCLFHTLGAKRHLLLLYSLAVSTARHQNHAEHGSHNCSYSMLSHRFSSFSQNFRFMVHARITFSGSRSYCCPSL